jgi:hypothetical protein
MWPFKDGGGAAVGGAVLCVASVDLTVVCRYAEAVAHIYDRPSTDLRPPGALQDFESISKIGDSKKREQAGKTGRFG